MQNSNDIFLLSEGKQLVVCMWYMDGPPVVLLYLLSLSGLSVQQGEAAALQPSNKFTITEEAYAAETTAVWPTPFLINKFIALQGSQI